MFRGMGRLRRLYLCVLSKNGKVFEGRGERTASSNNPNEHTVHERVRLIRRPLLSLNLQQHLKHRTRNRVRSQRANLIVAQLISDDLNEFGRCQAEFFGCAFDCTGGVVGGRAVLEDGF